MLWVMNSTVCRSDSHSRSRSARTWSRVSASSDSEGLVHQEDGRAVHQGAGDRHALAHAPRKLPRVSVGAWATPSCSSSSPRGRRTSRSRGAGCAPAATRCRARFGTRARGRPGRRSRRPSAGPRAPRLPPGSRRWWAEQPGRHEHQGALAAAARSDDAHELPGRMCSEISVRAWVARWPSIGNALVTRSMSIAAPRSLAIRGRVGAAPAPIRRALGRKRAGRNSYV